MKYFGATGFRHGNGDVCRVIPLAVSCEAADGLMNADARTLKAPIAECSTNPLTKAVMTYPQTFVAGVTTGQTHGGTKRYSTIAFETCATAGNADSLSIFHLAPTLIARAATSNANALTEVHPVPTFVACASTSNTNPFAGGHTVPTLVTRTATSNANAFAETHAAPALVALADYGFANALTRDAAPVEKDRDQHLGYPAELLRLFEGLADGRNGNAYQHKNHASGEGYRPNLGDNISAHDFLR